MGPGTVGDRNCRGRGGGGDRNCRGRGGGRNWGWGGTAWDRKGRKLQLSTHRPVPQGGGRVF